MGKVLHASYSGYFPFPFCLSENNTFPTGRETFYPIGLSFEQAVSLYWRVSKWQFSDNFTPSSNETIFEFTYYPALINIPEEKYLVCSSGFVFDRVFNEQVPGFVFSQISEGYLFQSPQLLPENIVKKDNLYYPQLFFSGQWLNFGDFGTGVTLFNPITDSNLVGSLRIEWLQYIVDIPLYSFYTNSYSVVLKAVEYWSYGGTWDTGTGARL